MDKKFISFIKLIIGSFLSALILAGISCKKNPELFRFIDHVDEVEVVKSPVKEIEKNIELIRQKWSEKDMSHFDLSGNTYLAFRTKGHLLGWDESKPPAGMELLRDDKKVEFSSSPSKDSLFWRWLRVEKTFNPVKIEELLEDNDRLELADKEEYEIAGIYLPAGEYFVDIKVESGDPKQYLPYLEFLIDDISVDRIPVGFGLQRFIVTMGAGFHSLKFIHAGSINLSSSIGEEVLILKEIKISLNGDLILVSPSSLKEEKDHIYEAVYRHYSLKTVAPIDSFKIRQGNSNGWGYSLQNRGEIEGSIELPADDCQLELICYSSPEGGFLTVWLDEQQINRTWILPYQRRSYQVGLNAECGRHKLKLRFSKLNQQTEYPHLRLHLGNLLLHKQESESITAILKMIQERPFAGDESDFNSSEIASKIRLGDYYVNGLFAPADSELVWETKIPQQGILEFGCGLLDSYQSHTSGEKDCVEFSVWVDDQAGKKKIYSEIFSSQLPKEISEPPLQNKIDLSDYEGKTVHLFFSTKNKTSEKPEEGDLKEKFGMSFWLNPVLYQGPTETKKRLEDVNIILISIDTLRADHLGCYGYEKKTSPNLDDFCSDSVLFLNSYSHSPSTLPSHMTMLTSLYPNKHKLVSQKVGIIQKPNPLIPRVSHILRSNDYFTAAFVDGGYLGDRFSFSRGFDFFCDDEKASKLNNSAGLLYKKASDWIIKNSEKKFFLFLHTYQVHSPYVSPEPYNLMFCDFEPIWKRVHIPDLLRENGVYNKFKKFTDEERKNIIALYDGTIRYTDEEFFKPLVKLLKDLKIYGRTMIIFTADHGEEFYEHGGWGHTHSLYNELIKVPMLIKFPTSKFQGQKVDSVSRIVDIFPTILDVTGIDPSDFLFDGESLLPYIKAKKGALRTSPGYKYIYKVKPNRPVMIELKNISLVEGFYKIILNYEYEPGHAFYKDPDIFPFPVFREEFYNLSDDRDETNNRIDNPEFGFRSVFEKIREWNRIAKEIEHEQVVFESSGQELRERLRALGYVH